MRHSTLYLNCSLPKPPIIYRTHTHARTYTHTQNTHTHIHTSWSIFVYFYHAHILINFIHSLPTPYLKIIKYCDRSLGEPSKEMGIHLLSVHLCFVLERDGQCAAAADMLDPSTIPSLLWVLFYIRLWRQQLPPTAATPRNQSFTFTFKSSSGDAAELTDVVFGDVYMCTGQVRMLPRTIIFSLTKKISLRYQRRTNAKKNAIELLLVTRRACWSGGGPTRGAGKIRGTVQRAYAV